MQQLSLSARPKTLDELVGQREIVKTIRGQIATGRRPKVYLFTGNKGTGKTTIARILALSYQCDHGKFGVPCKECRLNRKNFDIHYVNAGRIPGIKELDQSLAGSVSQPRFGQYRIYILDECHRFSQQAQELMLGYLEDDTPATTVFILCTTAPQMLVETIQSRCTVCKLKELEEEDIAKLVPKLLQLAGSDMPADRLVMCLAEKGVGSPRLIAMAVDKYTGGASPEAACDVMASTIPDTRALTKAVVHGDWPSAAKYLEDMQSGESQGVRLGTMAYMRKMLLHSTEITERSAAIARAIDELVNVQPGPELVQASALVAGLYRATAYFAKYKG